MRCVRMRDPHTLAKQWDQQVRGGAIWWVGKPLENAPPPPGEPDPDNPAGTASGSGTPTPRCRRRSGAALPTHPWV